MRGSAGRAETAAAAVQAVAVATSAGAHRAGSACAAAKEAAATGSSKRGDVPWRTYAACVFLVLAFAVQDGSASVAAILIAGYLACSETEDQQVQVPWLAHAQAQVQHSSNSSSESDGDGSLVSRPATAPTGLDLAGYADGEPCTQLPDPEPEGALRDVSGNDRGEWRAAPSEPKHDSTAVLQEHGRGSGSSRFVSSLE